MVGDTERSIRLKELLDDGVSKNIIEVIDILLEMARPGGIAHRRLIKYREQAENNVMLGPSIMKYIRKLQIIATDSIECRFLTQLGKCRNRKRRLACDHIEDNKECMLYEGNRPKTRGNPLRRIQS